MPVRLGPQSTGPSVFLDLSDNCIKPPRRDVALYLLIPLIIFPTMQPRSKLSALFKRVDSIKKDTSARLNKTSPQLDGGAAVCSDARAHAT
jgi:hypothetical protein